jgi:chromatin remodeling complex protein RSC6
MPRMSSKQTSSKTASASPAVNEQVVAPVELKAEPEVVAPTKKGKKAKKEPTEKTVESVTETVAPSSAVEKEESAPVSENVVAEPVASSVSVVDSTIVSLLAELASLDQQEVLIQQQRRNKRRLLEKAIIKVLKANSKASSKKQKRFGNRQPSGFIRPTLISDELASFLGKESGTEMARTAVTNLINNYIKTNNLKDLKNGRQINADAKLSTLLKLSKDDVLTYFNLQKYMKHHFVRKPVVDATQPVVV